MLASLVSFSGDIAGAEDALAEAFAKALEVWPRDGCPDSAEAWLLTTARNKLRDHYKSAAHRSNVSAEEIMEPAVTPVDPETIPDERLKLMFVCAHPAIDAKIHAPLMLQTVLGLEAKQIAAAYLLPAATLAQQLVRAKRKILQARIPFVLPTSQNLSPRITSVMEAIYGASAIEWLGDTSTDLSKDLATEALYLADLLVELLPQQAECLGLAALLGFSYARRDARQSARGFVPLSEQDTSIWNQRHIARANNLLNRAGKLENIGRFQLEAAIQSVHSARHQTGQTDWQAITHLYEGLMQLTPTLGAAVAQAAALSKWRGANAGLSALDNLDEQLINNFQPYWATRAHMLAERGDLKEASKAYSKAITLTENKNMAAYLERQQSALFGNS